MELWQPRKGYRFSVDPLLLVDFARHHGCTAGSVCDIGAGSGIIGLALAATEQATRVTGLEVQERLYRLACRNAEENRLGTRVQMVHIDASQPESMKRQIAGASFDWVLANPPYHLLERGPAAPDEECAIAQHEIRLNAEHLIRESRRLLRPNGYAAFVYPVDRLVEVLARMEAASLRPVGLCFVHSFADEAATRFMVLGRKGASSELQVEAPFVVYDSVAVYSGRARIALGEE